MNVRHMSIECEEVKPNKPQTYLVRNTVNNQFVRLGLSETYYLLTILDAQDMKKSLGMGSVEELPIQLKEVLRKKFEEWGFFDEEVKAQKKSGLERIKKIHLVKFNVEKVLNVIYPIYSKVFTKPFFITLMVCIGVLFSIFMYAIQYALKVGATEQIGTVDISFSVIDIVGIISFLIINLFLHEFAHAVTCIKYGGKVNSMGIVLYYFIPCCYCDVSSVYNFKNKWHRGIVALSGIMVNLAIGCISMGISIVLLCFGKINILLIYVAISTVLTSIYNLIPFVKLDGYWFLQAISGIDNLMDKAIIIAYTTIFKREKLNTINLSRNKVILLAIYGVISLFFNTIFWILSFISIIDFFNITGNLIIISSIFATVVILSDFYKTFKYYGNIIKNDFDRMLITI